VLSRCELRRCASVLERRFPSLHLDRVVQPDRHRVALAFSGRDAESGERVKRVLMLSTQALLGRVSQLDALPRAPERPPAFASYLRAHLSRARLVSVRMVGEERQLAFRLEGREGSFDLLLSLLGRRSNLYVLDSEARVVAALRALEKTRRTLAIGEPWHDPADGEAREGEDRFAAVDDDGYLSAVEAHYAAGTARREQDDLALRLARSLRKERKQSARRLARIEQELAEADRAGELQRTGELLKTVLSQVAPGQSEVRARDYESGEEVVISLDPSKTPQQNLEATFKRYQKLLRRLTKAGGQVDAARARDEELAGLEQELETARESTDAAALERLAGRPEVARMLSKHAPRDPTKAGDSPARPGRERDPLRDVPQRLRPRRYQTHDGLEIWVGRSDDGNDYLTTRLARGKDLFFHLDGAPGSHVILRTEGREDPPQESLLDACELAVRFSKAKNATRADVHVVPIKQVKKPKGAKKGLVWVTGGRTVHLRREEKRLSRLMSSKLDD